MRIAQISRVWRFVLALGSITLLAATAFAANLLFTQGRLIPHAAPTDSPDNDVAIFESLLTHEDVSPWHYHTGELYGVVRQGTMVEDLGCGKTQVFTEGTALHVPLGVIHQVRNEGNPAAQISFSQLFPHGEPLIVPASEPTCP